VTTLPHHQDTPFHALVRLGTATTNQYRYLQLRQRLLYPLLPVHTHAEYVKFKSIIGDKIFLLQSAKTNPHPPHQAYKDIDYTTLAKFWNSEVEKQDRVNSHETLDTTPGTQRQQEGPPTDSSDRIYYKIPSQLKTHHQKVLKFNSARATMLNGTNVTALEPFLAFLTNSQRSREKVLPAIPLEADLSVHTTDGEQ
jgi:hypothetical protein